MSDELDEMLQNLEKLADLRLKIDVESVNLSKLHLAASLERNKILGELVTEIKRARVTGFGQ